MIFPKLKGILVYNEKNNHFMQKGGHVGTEINLWTDVESLKRTLNVMITGEVRYSYKTGQYTVDEFEIIGPVLPGYTAVKYSLDDMSEWGIFDIETQEFKGSVREILVVLINKRLDSLTKKLLKKEPDADIQVEYVK